MQTTKIINIYQCLHQKYIKVTIVTKSTNMLGGYPFLNPDSNTYQQNELVEGLHLKSKLDFIISQEKMFNAIECILF